MIKRILFILALAVLAVDAQAQCAPGIPSAGNPGCIPPDQANSPYYQPNAAMAQPVVVSPVWADRWAAIAIDSRTGDAGFSTDRTSKRDASQSAIDDCKSAGSAECKLLIAYYNQCAAVAQIRGGGEVFAATAAGLEDAKRQAAENCDRKGGTCDVVYSNCVLAARVR